MSELYRQSKELWGIDNDTLLIILQSVNVYGGTDSPHFIGLIAQPVQADSKPVTLKYESGVIWFDENVDQNTVIELDSVSTENFLKEYFEVKNIGLIDNKKPA